MGAKHSFSLSAKLAALDIGEQMFLQDTAPLMGPTRMERNVQTAMVRSPRLKGRRFVTSRADVIVSRRHYHLIRIERVE